MTPEYYQKVRGVFGAACAIPPSERRKWLENQCADDRDLLAEVQSLLDHHNDQNDTHDDTHLQIAKKLLGDTQLVGSQTGVEGSQNSTPDMIGQYRILRQIGEGGMGIVFEAKQENPRRKVALKLLRMGFSSPSMLRRFQREAEMLGRLRHVGIAHIYESGVHTTPTGAKVPYFAMELIHGVPLTEYARREALDVRNRLSLFTQVCDAVDHAHENGVIHRDLKPCNVLVEPGGQPKVLDFGIARATDSDLRATTLHTSVGQLIGTVSYMSPEQANGQTVELDRRSDVYSLGIMLFELLTDRFPYDIKNRTIPDAVRVIQQSDPMRVSSLDRGLGGDIETIISKALEKERGRRYESAAALAGDIRRYLAHEPIIARPTTTWYQVRKFSRRHRTLVVASAISVLLLIGGIAGTTKGWLSAREANRRLGEAVVEATGQRDRAIESELRAATELSRSRQTTAFLRAILRSVNPSVARDLDTTLLRELLDLAVAKMDRGDLSGQPAVEAEMRSALAETYMGIGDNTRAQSVIEPAMRLARSAPQPQMHEFLRARVFHATTLVHWGRFTEAKAEFEECLAIHENAPSPNDEVAGILFSNFGGLLGNLGEPEDALRMHERAMDIRRRLLGVDHPDVAASLANIAGCLKDLKRHEEALDMMDRALKVYREMDPPGLLQITILQNNIADLLLIMNRPDEAETRVLDALNIGKRIFKPEHQQLGILTHTLGRVQRAQENHLKAYEHFLEAKAVLVQAFYPMHPYVVMTQTDLGIELTFLGRFDEAERGLLVAHEQFSDMDDRPIEAQVECVAAIVRLYEAWHQQEPSRGFLFEATKWKIRLAGSEPKTGTTPEQGD